MEGKWKFLTTFLLISSTQVDSATSVRLVISASRLPVPSAELDVVYDGNDSVYILGGLDSIGERGYLVTKYSLETGSIDIIGNLPVTHGSAIMHGEDIIYFGGSNGSYTSDIYRYSTRTNTYTVVSSLPGTLVYMACAWDSTNQAAFLIGGHTLIGGKKDQILRYNAWNDEVHITTARLPETRSIAIALWSKQQEVAYIFDGFTDLPSSDIIKFDPSRNIVTEISARLHGSALYMCGVFIDATEEAYIVTRPNAIAKFDAITEQVSRVAVENWPLTLEKIACTYVPKFGRIYFFGGYGSYDGGWDILRDEISYVDLYPLSSTTLPIASPEPPTEFETQPTTLNVQSETPGASESPPTDVTEHSTEAEASSTIPADTSEASSTTGADTPEVSSTTAADTPEGDIGEPLPGFVYTAIGFCVVLLLALILATWWVWYVRKRRSPRLPEATYLLLKEMLTHDCRTFELSRKDFLITPSAVLGSGEFGIVVEALVRGTQAAAKTVGGGVTDVSPWRCLLQELRVNVKVGLHDNVVALIGAHTKGLRHGFCFIFFELCANRSLENYIESLRNKFHDTCLQPTPVSRMGYLDFIPIIPPSSRIGQLPIGILTPHHLHQWSVDISAGMAHLSSLHIVHSDLATRNVLLTDRLVAKVADFGLSHKVYDAHRAYVTGDTSDSSSPIRMPWQHMAPETLGRLRFSEQSDVWAFGVTMWQIYTLGSSPYAPADYSDEFLQLLEGDLRLEKPTHASDDIYDIMQICWALSPCARPLFVDIHAALVVKSGCSHAQAKSLSTTAYI